MHRLRGQVMQNAAVLFSACTEGELSLHSIELSLAFAFSIAAVSFISVLPRRSKLPMRRCSSSTVSYTVVVDFCQHPQDSLRFGTSSCITDTQQKTYDL